MYDTMRRLHPRGSRSRGIAVDDDGAMLGPDCVLVRRTAQGYRCISRDDADALQDFLFGVAREPDWLFGQCSRIAKVLDNGEIALAQILGLQIPIGYLGEDQLRGLAAVAPLIKANFNPDEPRIPKGNPDGGEWTTGGASTALHTGTPHDSMGVRDGRGRKNPNTDGSGDTRPSPGVANTGNTDGGVLPAAYPGDYHDAVVQALESYLKQKGGTVITGVTLNAINGITAVADMMVRFSSMPPFIIEVKTGPGAQFTQSQMIVYPMAQIGRHVSSPNSSLNNIGLTPGELLPPLDIYIYWVRAPGQRGKLIKLPGPEFVP